MIPKIIHFTWFSNDPYPDTVKRCMETWKEFLPDYEFIHWDMEKISGIDNNFLKQALEMKKWAFAADYVRLYALVNHGGIYIDTDVLVYKNFDELLTNTAFIGRENSFHLQGRRGVRYLTSHFMGGEKGHPFFKACLDYYTDRNFILSRQEWLPANLKFDLTILPEIQYEIAKTQGYDPSEKVKGTQLLDNGLAVYPFQYFDSFDQNKKSYIRHLALGGWREIKNKGIANFNLKKKAHIAIHRLAEAAGYSIFKNL